MSRRQRCATTCGRAGARWAGRPGRCSSRRCTRRASGPRSTGARRTSSSQGRRRGGPSVLQCARRSRARRSVKASLVETQQAFLELHVDAFEWFGGIFEQIRFDNLTSAVKQVLKGRRRVETDRLIALRSHYLFSSQFTTPGIQGAHEKGGVEGEVGRFRRNHLVPVPVVADLAELDALLLAGCEADLRRRIVGRTVTVGEAWMQERPLLRALPGSSSTPARSRRRVSTPSRWSRSARTATRSRSVSPG